MRSYAGAWVFPGGHIEVNEGLDEGTLREFKEECGIEVTKDASDHSYLYNGHKV